ncbi:MAG: DUF2442 domain-containing protein [Bacteroidota bacterium]
MKKIVSLFSLENFQLKVKFDNGIEKKFDLNSYFQFPVFAALKNICLFQRGINREYFIEWQGQEMDLSTDTL